MARYIGPVCRLCRREGMKLFLKGERCYTEKCAIEKRNFRPASTARRGRRSWRATACSCARSRSVKRIYGVLENQFRRYFEAADRQRGITGETLLQMLERRLDNVVYRLGFATSRAQARQLVRHGHFSVNGRKVDIPSFSRHARATSSACARRSQKSRRRAARDGRGQGPRDSRSGSSLQAEQMTGRVVSLPTREQINLPVQEQLIVELYSK